MSKLNLKNLKRQDDVAAPEDTLGGGGPIESGIYEGVIDVAFLKESQKGAMGLELHLTLENGRKYRETLWVTKQNGDNYYESNNTKRYLPGFIVGDEIAALAANMHLADVETEEKVVKLYDYKTKEEKPEEVPMLTGLLGEKLLFGILEEMEFKTQKGDDDKYYTIDETINKNTINKVFSLEGFTVNELIAETENAEFIEQWKERYEGKVNDRTKGKKPDQTTGKSSGAQAGKPKTLFKGKS